MKRKTQFDRAKTAAEKLLQKRLKQRTTALALIQELSIEIPNLERTIRALDAQLNSKEVVATVPENIQGRHANVEHLSETSDIPAEVLAQLPPDYLEPYKPVEDDSLPEIEGKPLTKDS